MAGISHNITAMGAYRNYSANSNALSRSLEKLSSGYKINRAGDDAAGLAISEKMRAQISGLNVAQKNAKDGISMVQTAEGALTEVHDMLNRMVTLAEQSANGTYSNDLDREQLQKEVVQLRSEINRIADSANFNGIKLLDGSMDSSNKVDLVSTTKTNTTFVAKSWDTFATSDIAPTAFDDNGSYVDGTLGVNTILHKQAGTVGKAEFSVDLNAFKVNGSGALNITVGSTNLRPLNIDAGALSSGSLDAAELTKKIAALYGTDTETINGEEFTVSADGNKLKFESVKNISMGVAVPVTVSMASSVDYVFGSDGAAMAVTGTNTGAKIQFDWASDVGSAEKLALIGTTAAITNSKSFDFTVGVSAELDTASFKGSAAYALTGTSFVTNDGRTAASKATVAYGSTGKITIKTGTGYTASSSAKVGVNVDVTNGNDVEDATVTFNLLYKGGSGGTAKGALSSSTSSLASGATVTIASTTVKNAVEKMQGFLTTTVSANSFGSGKISNISGPGYHEVENSRNPNGVYVDSGVIKISDDATANASDTISLTFDVALSATGAPSAVNLTMDFKVGDFFDGVMPTGSTSVTASKMRTVIANRVQDLFETSKMVKKPDTSFHGTVKATTIGTTTVGTRGTVAASSGALKIKALASKQVKASDTVTVKYSVDNSGLATDAKGDVKIKFKVSDFGLDTFGNNTAITKTVSIDTITSAANKYIANVVNADDFAIGKSFKVDVATGASNSPALKAANATKVASYSTSSGLKLYSDAKTSADLVNFTFSIGVGDAARDVSIQMKLADIASFAGVEIPEKANEYVMISNSQLKSAVEGKMQQLFGEYEDNSPTKTIKLGAAPDGYEYHAVSGDASEGASATTMNFSGGVTVGTQSGTVKATNNVVTIELWSKADGDTAAAKVGTFTVDLSEVSNTVDVLKHYSATDAGPAKTEDPIAQILSYNKLVEAAGTGDYNVKTEVINPGGAEGGSRLASTKLEVSDVFDGKIADGAVLKVGNQNYIFAVGSKSKLTADDDGNILVDLKDIELGNGKSGLDGKELQTALKRLTLAAKGNEMFGVGYDSTAEQITLTENVDYYGDGEGKVLLNTKAKIAEQLAWGKVSSQTVKEVDNASVARVANDLVLQIGDTSDSFNQLKVSMKDMHTDAMGIGSIDISNQEGAQIAVDKIKDAINYVSDMRGTLGATQNRLEHTINNLSVMAENVQDAESTIRDTDVAEEMMAFTKWSILNQAAQAMLAQANQLPQGVLQLLG